MHNELANLTTECFGRSFFCFDELSSTNDYLKENGRLLPHGTAVIAYRQYAGKGRTGKRWENTAEDGKALSLALSVLLKPPTVHHTQVLPLVCGLAVKKAIERVTGLAVGIKWPNDLVINEKKVCGILCEGVVSGDNVFTVCGIGVNILEEAADFERKGLAYATSLFVQSGRQYPILDIATAILCEFEEYYNRFMKDGFLSIIDEYRIASVTVGSDVRVIENGSQREGRAIDIAEDGALLVNIEGTLFRINAGEASVRGLYGYI